MYADQERINRLEHLAKELDKEFKELKKEIQFLSSALSELVKSA